WRKCWRRMVKSDKGWGLRTSRFGLSYVPRIRHRVLSPGQNIDRYVVEALIGSGGTAMVYRVRHRQLNTWHALKVLSVTSAAIRDRMLREGRVQAELRHLNIVAVTDILDIDGSPGLLLEYIDG